jgi:hypothetical protein
LALFLAAQGRRQKPEGIRNKGLAAILGILKLGLFVIFLCPPIAPISTDFR